MLGHPTCFDRDAYILRCMVRMDIPRGRIPLSSGVSIDSIFYAERVESQIYVCV